VKRWKDHHALFPAIADILGVLIRIIRLSHFSIVLDYYNIIIFALLGCAVILSLSWNFGCRSLSDELGISFLILLFIWCCVAASRLDETRGWWRLQGSLLENPIGGSWWTTCPQFIPSSVVQEAKVPPKTRVRYYCSWKFHYLWHISLRRPASLSFE
jgi:hypothetical protein